MILVDDSGWGSLLGGVMIGLHDTETRKSKCKLIPVSYFQGKKFVRADYRDYATKIFLSMWTTMGSKRNLHICRGTVLDNIHKHLLYLGLDKTIQRVEILDPLQAWLEDRFALHLVEIGVPRKSSGAHCLSFNEQLEWIKEDPKRVKYVKTGWPSWKLKYEKQVLLK